MVNINTIISMLRRRIGDTESPYGFDDSLLQGYIEDAVYQVELDYPQGFTINSGVFNKEPDMNSAILFAIQAHYLFKVRTKDKADRDNFLMKKGRLTLDNTNQSSDHKETLELIEKEYKKTLYRVKNGGGSIEGVRVE